MSPTGKAVAQLRGLEGRTYDVVDYVNGTKRGTVSGHNAHLTVQFEEHLRLEGRAAMKCGAGNSLPEEYELELPSFTKESELILHFLETNR